jgi:hypothetical protein
MAIRVRKIGWEKSSLFNKHFDKVYDFWKNKAQEEYNYHKDLKLIKEHNKVFIYIVIPDVNQFTEKEDWMIDNDDIENIEE